MEDTNHCVKVRPSNKIWSKVWHPITAEGAFTSPTVIKSTSEREETEALLESADEMSLSEAEDDNVIRIGRKRGRFDDSSDVGCLEEDLGDDLGEVAPGDGVFAKNITLMDPKPIIFGDQSESTRGKASKSSSIQSRRHPSYDAPGVTTRVSLNPPSSSTHSQYRRSQDGQDNTEEQGGDKGVGQPLWQGLHRRPKGTSTEGHKPIVLWTKTLLLARIFSGQGPEGRKCSPWPDRNIWQLNVLMQECWNSIRSRRGRQFNLDLSLPIGEIPIDFEAKQMYDAVGEFRSRALEKIRALVGSHYCFGDPKDHREKVAALLNKDNFTVDDGSKTGQTRFIASIIVKAIAKIFFHPGSKSSFGQIEYTAEYFRSLLGETVIYVCVCLAFALGEFSSGKRVAAKFEGAGVEGIYYRTQRTWDKQSAMKQKAVLAILNKRVKNQAGYEDGQIEELHAAVPNPFKDSFEDMEHCIDELPPDLQDQIRARPRESRADSDRRRDSLGLSSPLGNRIIHSGDTESFGSRVTVLSSVAADALSSDITDPSSLNDENIDGVGDAEDTWIIRVEEGGPVKEMEMNIYSTREEFCDVCATEPEEMKLWYKVDGQSESILRDREEFERMVLLVQATESRVVVIRGDRVDEWQSPR